MGKKCQPCQENKCERKYSNRHLCEGKDWCTCSCQEEAGETAAKGFLSIVSGVGMVAGGIAFTVATGGVGAALIGGVIVGAGSSLAINPVAKKISGERQTGKDLAIDVTVGAATGVLTGGIGVAGSAVSQGCSGAVKLAARAGAGLAGGIVGGGLSEGGRAVKGEEVSKESVAKAVAFGAISGGIGGASTHAASNITKVIDSGAGKAITRIAIQTGTGTACAASAEVISEGGMPSADGLRRIALAAGSQAVLASTSECASNVAKRQIYNEKYGGKEVKNLPKHQVDEQNQKVSDSNTKKSLETTSKMLKADVDQLHFEKNTALSELKTNHDASQESIGKRLGETASAYNAKIDNVKNTLHEINRQYQQVKNKPGPDLILDGNKNIHFLDGERTGQIAVEPAGANGVRGPVRSVWDQQGTFVGHTNEHDYGNLQRPLGQAQRDYSQTYNVAENAAEEEGLKKKRKKKD